MVIIISCIFISARLYLKFTMHYDVTHVFRFNCITMKVDACQNLIIRGTWPKTDDKSRSFSLSQLTPEHDVFFRIIININKLLLLSIQTIKNCLYIGIHFYKKNLQLSFNRRFLSNIIGQFDTITAVNTSSCL